MRKIAIAISKGGVGKSTTAVNLTYGLAKHGDRVLLIDADTQGQCSRMLGIDPGPGLAELIAGECEHTKAITEARPGLWLLRGGQGLASSKQLIAQREFKSESVLSGTIRRVLRLRDNRLRSRLGFANCERAVLRR